MDLKEGTEVAAATTEVMLGDVDCAWERDW